MSDVQNQTLSGKLENSFLGILRVVILVVLAISLIGSIIFAVMGASNLTASPTEYKLKEPNTKDLVDDIKKSLEAPKAAPTQKEQDAPSPQNNEKLDAEIEKQMKLVSDFLSKFERNLSNSDGFRNALRNRAESLAFDPDDDSSVLSYAKGQTEFFDRVFSDMGLLESAKKLDDQRFSGFFSAVMSTYPDYYRKQKAEQERFDAKQAAEAMAKQAGAALYLYIAAGMFVAFLLISLILVLVKIERNLRVRPI